MEQVFGVLSPFLILTVLMLCTEWVKRNYYLSGRTVQLIALGLCLLVVIPYQLASAWPVIAPMIIFSAIVYALLTWLAVIGMYEVALKGLGQNDTGGRSE